jgi:predicted nucleic acid-binding protein
VNRPRAVVSDTGPLISLEKVQGGFGFIRLLYDRIIVPPAVVDELYQGQFLSAEAYLAHYAIADLVEVALVSAHAGLPEIRLLDRGEREAIALALERGLPLLIEETAGRRVAMAAGLHISGIAGQVVKAYREGILDAETARGILRELLQAGRIGTRIHDGLVAAIAESPPG